jgi:hypothetical protein
MRQIFQPPGNLLSFLHARPHRSNAREHDHIAGLNAAFCVRPNKSPLGLWASISSVSGKLPAGPAPRV